jgi:ATP-dependent helicase/nuclease subunit A
MNSARPSGGVRIVTASAGTGKTYHLTSAIEAEIHAGRKPERILATTFTIKAAEELRERARARLLEKGQGDNAIRLLGARIGTVNGICGGLVSEFALGLGLSPVAEVISDKVQTNIFHQAADASIGKYANELDRLAGLFGYDQGQKRKDWRDDVNAIVERARANNIAPEALAGFAERSVAGFTRLMPKPLADETEAGVDTALRAAINELLVRYPTNDGLKQVTAASLEAIREAGRSPKIADLPWSIWAKLAKSSPAKADEPHFQPLCLAASAFSRHPRLLAQVERFITASFACAAEAMHAYEVHKRKWGLVDFVDQERLALQLLTKPGIAPSLRERIEAVFIDEFQDTSPLQLAVFVALSQIAQSSVWVGDPKQAIYGFRGTDPDLITHVAPSIQAATGGEAATLGKSYRSRPGLVSFVNDAFGATFAAMGLPPGTTRVDDVDRDDLPGQPPPFAVWHIEGKNIGLRASALAGGIKHALAHGTDWAVARVGTTGPLAAGDVAVLCRSNADCLTLAAALSTLGLKVAIERGGLFGTPEVRLALAALRWCADQRDSLALAELAHLLHEDDDQPAWFEASLQDDGREALATLVPMAADLHEIAKRTTHQSPLEFVDSVLTRGGISDALRRWGNIEDRLLNLEALRQLVAAYQDERHQNRAPTTATDLCAWLSEQNSGQPPSRSADAITITTYHGAKGLEWPLVILTDLEDKPKGSAFGLHVMSDIAADKIDWKNPLGGRWLRFWPWPFGAQKKDVFLDATAASSVEGKLAARVERDERARLLYVGATRARDYLVFALPKSNAGWAWLDELHSDAGNSAVVAPAPGETKIQVNGRSHDARVTSLAPADEVQISPPTAVYKSQKIEAPTLAPLALRPSSEGRFEDAQIIEEIDLGARLPFTGSPDMARVGEALHRFLAADDPVLESGVRVALASRLLNVWGVTGLDPRDVVTMSTRFHAFLNDRWPGALLRRETLVMHRLGHRTLSGRIDVIVETPKATIVIDHKSFPGNRTQWVEQAKRYAAQLRLYSGTLKAATSMLKPIHLALHLPISGEVLMVE